MHVSVTVTAKLKYNEKPEDLHFDVALRTSNVLEAIY
jgi:hypothetical protein